MATDEFRVLVRCRDFEASVEFWRDVLELEQVGSWDRDDSSGAVLATGGNAVVVLIGAGATNYDFPQQDGVYVGVKVEDVDAAYARLQKLDVAVEHPPGDKLWDMRTVGLRDPNGVYVYLFTPTDS